MIPEELLSTYQVLQLIHHGIAGDVWLVEHIRLSGRRVLKSIEKSHPQHDVLAEEAKTLQKCRHPSIPIIYDILEFDTQTIIVEEFLEGETLKQYILRQRSLTASHLLNFSLQLCEILKFLHNPERAILYLDLKPENIIISNLNLKLVDFGSAICRDNQENDCFIFGTPRYCAPEMLTHTFLSERTDLYCLGRCLEYMLFYTPTAPKGYRKIVEKCLRMDGKEYESADEILVDLKKLEGRKRKEKTKEVWYAVTGVLSEHDSSMMALQLAVYLKKRYKKPVLYLDCSEGSLMEQLEQAEENQKNEGEQKSFVFERNGITVAKRVAPQEVRGWRGRGFRYIVACFGKTQPCISGCPFRLALCAGAVTGFSLQQWQTFLPKLCKEQKTVLMLTGGDEALAKTEFGSMCTVRKILPFFHEFKQSKCFARQMKGLTKKQ